MTKLIKLFLLVSLWWSFYATSASAQTINAASCSQADIVTALGRVAADGTTVVIPACKVQWSGSTTPLTVGTASVNSTGDVSYSPVYSMTIQGQTVCTGNGTVASPISCNDATNIDMHLAGTSNSILTITTAANKTFRLTGISINWGGGSTSEDHGALYITGNSTQVRVDHSHFNQIVHVGIQLDHIYGCLTIT